MVMQDGQLSVGTEEEHHEKSGSRKQKKRLFQEKRGGQPCQLTLKPKVR